MFSFSCKQTDPSEHNIFVHYIIFLQVLLFSLAKYKKQHVFMKIFIFCFQTFQHSLQFWRFYVCFCKLYYINFPISKLYLLILVSKGNYRKIATSDFSSFILVEDFGRGFQTFSSEGLINK